jgi:hypothetical protein
MAWLAIQLYILCKISRFQKKHISFPLHQETLKLGKNTNFKGALSDYINHFVIRADFFVTLYHATSSCKGPINASVSTSHKCSVAY